MKKHKAFSFDLNRWQPVVATVRDIPDVNYDNKMTLVVAHWTPHETFYIILHSSIPAHGLHVHYEQEQ